MSDPKSTYGQPVDEPQPVDDDVVGRAHEGLAHAEAAQRDVAEPSSSDEAGYAVEPPASTAADSEPAATVDDRAADAASVTSAADAAAAPADTHKTYDTDWLDRADEAERAKAAAVDPTPADVAAETAVVAAPVATTAYEPVAPAAASPVETPAPVAQPIFVQAPEAPRPRGNRGAAGAIGVLAALAFGVLYLGAWAALGFIDGTLTGSNIGTEAVNALMTAGFWVPVVVFYIGFWLLGAIINRGRWSAWVIFGLLVGLAAYVGHILGQLFQAPFWELTAREGSDLVESQLLAPLAIAAFVIGRELTIWFGSWVSARGRRVTELNVEAQREYERTLEAGPQLARV